MLSCSFIMMCHLERLCSEPQRRCVVADGGACCLCSRGDFFGFVQFKRSVPSHGERWANPEEVGEEREGMASWWLSAHQIWYMWRLSATIVLPFPTISHSEKLDPESERRSAQANEHMEERTRGFPSEPSALAGAARLSPPP
ncbi:hypothetical protein DAI22_11g143000 [Oryza sativa Japonica Group]|nr:hypothetical protein DAI22_11g143000 [Oryza sativa Japonica Group]